jgi:hypothetical protein
VHCPGVLETAKLAGQVNAGGCVSLTVTVKVHEPILPDASCAVQVTVVAPFENAEPDGGVQFTAPTLEQLSVALGVT